LSCIESGPALWSGLKRPSTSTWRNVRLSNLLISSCEVLSNSYHVLHCLLQANKTLTYNLKSCSRSRILDINLYINTFTARRVCIARTMPWQDVGPSGCPSGCPSVCLSHAGILSKRLYISSKFFSPSGNHSSFSTPNGMAIFRPELH